MENKEYEKLVDELVNEFKKTLPKNEKKMAEKFKEYLYILVNKWENETSKFLIRNRDEIEKELRSVTKKMSTYELEKKEGIFIEDEKFTQIIAFSNDIYEIAKGVLKDETQEIDLKDMKKKLDTIVDLSEKVKIYNKAKAKKLVSESILDFKFISDSNKEFLSIRLAEEKNSIEEKFLISKKIDKGEER